MQQIITAKLKLKTTPEQFVALRQTQLVYRDALNYVSQYAFEDGKTSNPEKLHKGTYRDIREKFKLQAEMTANAIRQVTSTYRGLWTKLKKNSEHRKAKITKKRFKGLDEAPTFASPTITYSYQRDYSFKKEQHVSVLTLGGRVIVPYQGFDKHVALIQHGASIKAAKLWYDKPHKPFYLLVALELEMVEPTPEVQQTVVGVDVGQRYLATSATMTNEIRFFSGRKVRARADHYARTRKRLQHKGTRSAKRRMIALSGRERRFKLNTNHVIAKTIVNAHPNALIGLEDLSGIRDRTKRPKRRRKGTQVLPLTLKQRRANWHASKWAFAELHGMIAYKAALSGSSFVVKVDADYTSKACPLCGYTDKSNRPGNGLTFECQNKDCGYQVRTGRAYRLHADLVGARNIAMRALLIRQDWVRTGQLSVAPDVSDREAKAVRLKRYAELRWSPDTSLLL